MILFKSLIIIKFIYNLYNRLTNCRLGEVIKAPLIR